MYLVTFLEKCNNVWMETKPIKVKEPKPWPSNFKIENILTIAAKKWYGKNALIITSGNRLKYCTLYRTNIEVAKLKYSITRKL